MQVHKQRALLLLVRRRRIMGVVTLSRPACRLPTALQFVRLTTEARVQHKAVKRMTRNRPIKVRLLLCRRPWLCDAMKTLSLIEINE